MFRLERVSGQRAGRVPLLEKMAQAHLLCLLPFIVAMGLSQTAQPARPVAWPVAAVSCPRHSWHYADPALCRDHTRPVFGKGA